MITPEDLENLLRRWGYVFGAVEREEPTSGSEHGLTASVLGSLHVGEGQLATRARRKIREYLGPDGKPRKEVAPAMVCHAKETRTANRPWTPPPELLEVEKAAIDLYHFNRLRGVVLRIEYCIHRTRQREKAMMVGQVEGISEWITLRRYRGELTLGREWMAGRLHGKKFAA